MDFDRISMQSQGGVRLFERPGSDIRMTGYLKKVKTMKKKFFVLRSTSSSGPARLEYYDTEKKFLAGQRPKREIYLHTCFNINRKADSRHKNAIALYLKEECFSVVCDDEKEQENWLALMLEYQNEFVHDGEKCREHYEYVWQVTLQPKGLGQTMNIRGPYRLCITRQNICLVKINSDKPQYVFQLETVRSLAHNDNHFRMEVGKIAPTGEGELWMQTDDADTAQNLHEIILNFMKTMDRRGLDNVHVISSTLPRQSTEFRFRSESFTQGSGRTRSKMEQRPVSVCTHTTRSTSHLHNAVSPGTSPLTHSCDHSIMGSHRRRSDSNDSKASRSSVSAINDDQMYDLHPHLIGPCSDIMPLEEEPDFVRSHSPDLRSIPSSPGSHRTDQDDYDGQGEGYIEMHPGSVTPPTPGNSGYLDMAPLSHKDNREGWSEHGSTYMPMNPTWSSSAPIPIHPAHVDTGMGYMDMSAHNPLPPVKEGGSTEGYLPMSPSYSASPSGSSSSHLRPDRVNCMLSDDGNDFSQPPTRTYSLGSRPVKTGSKYSGYVDMSGRKGVSDNGRSCSAPHLITHHPHHHRSGRNSNLDSPTPSASPLSMSLKSDDSDSFMELDFERPRTASDSYNYRPRASSFGMPAKSLAQGHRPRSSSHGQGTRPQWRQRWLGVVESSGRLGHDIRLQSSSHGSFDSLKVSSSESLRKLSQEVRTKTSQLNNSDYMDMSFEKRHTPSPQPNSAASSRSGQNGYVDMTLGHRKPSPSRSKMGSRSNSKTSSSEKLQESDYTNMSLGSASGTDSMYMNFDSHEGGGKKDSPSRSSSSENVDAYIMYEPATTPTSSSGKGIVPKGESTSPDPRSRSGSGGKDQKKRGFFSSRHSHGDPSKHSLKKSESCQQPSGLISYSSTGGEKFGSLGRNIRQKSIDSEKSGGRKSSSFSKTFGISASKPGKLLKKTPTPPKSLDGNDEYIEFSPMAVKSDSDSSHSSESTHASRSRHEASSAKGEAEYVGFEPGNIPASSSSSGQLGTTSTSSGYLPMNTGGSAGGQGAMFKPVKKSGTKRSKSAEESNQPSLAVPPTTTPSLAETQPFAKPVPMYPSTQRQSSTMTTSTTSTTTMAAPALPQSRVGTQETGGLEKPLTIPTAVTSLASSSLLPSSEPSTPSTPSSSNSSFVMVSKSPSLGGNESGYMDFDPGKPAASTPASLPVASTVPKPAVVPSLIRDDTATSTASTAPQHLPAAASPTKSIKPTWGRSNSSSSSTAKTTLTSQTLSEAASPTSASASSSPPSMSSPTKSSSSEKCSSSASGKNSCTSPGNSEPQPVVSPTAVSCASHQTRKGSGGTLPTRKTSGDRSSLGNSGGSINSQANVAAAANPSSDIKTGGSGSAGENGRSKPKEARSPRLSQGSQSPSSSTQQGLTRPDSTPCMLSMDKPTTTGRGRGRHSSSSSLGTGQPRKGKNSLGNEPSKEGSVSKSDTGMLQINTGAEARHSITDLSGYEEMSFPSNALSRQQPSHCHNRQQHPSTASSQGSGSVGGSQGVLNYATLDLGSADSMGDSGDTTRSPRNKSRHPSSADEKNEPPLSYATIDFEKSENLRNSASKDKRTL